MKRASLLVCLFVFGGLGLAALAVPSATAQNPGTRAKSTAASQQAGKESQTFMGKIEQAHGRCVLEESSTSATFQLDDQIKAKPFIGKTVKVRGTLDLASNTIHVVDIRAV